MIVKDLVYILQSEEYSAVRFLKFVYTHFNWLNLEKRRQLKWTKKSSALFSMSLMLMLLVGVLGFCFFKWWGLLILLVVVVLAPFLILLNLFFLLPLDKYLKLKSVAKAKEKIRKSDVIVIGITGSYGKTSTKMILNKILSEKFSVLATPNSVNTYIGVANFVNEELTNQDVLIVEMGAYKTGEIKSVCDLVQPDYSILTGINEAHLERFGSIENTIKAKFELSEATKKAIVLNMDDENIASNYKKFKLPEVIEVKQSEAENVRVESNFSGLKFEWQGVELETRLLAKHNVVAILICVKLAMKFGVPLEKIARGVKKIEYVPHRLEPSYSRENNVWVIDDSYNANWAGVESGLEVLARAPGRKVLLTPGPLVEVGEKYHEIHKRIGKRYARMVDLVLLIKSKETDAVIDGLKEAEFSNYKQYKTTEEAHKDLKNILKPGDTLLLQNDFPDVYF